MQNVHRQGALRPCNPWNCINFDREGTQNLAFMVQKYILGYKKDGCPLDTTKIYMNISLNLDKKGLTLCIFSLQNTKFSCRRPLCNPCQGASSLSPREHLCSLNRQLQLLKIPHVENLPEPMLGPWISSWPRALAKINPALEKLFQVVSVTMPFLAWVKYTLWWK